MELPEAMRYGRGGILHFGPNIVSQCLVFRSTQSIGRTSRPKIGRAKPARSHCQPMLKPNHISRVFGYTWSHEKYPGPYPIIYVFVYQINIPMINDMSLSPKATWYHSQQINPSPEEGETAGRFSQLCMTWIDAKLFVYIRKIAPVGI